MARISNGVKTFSWSNRSVGFNPITSGMRNNFDFSQGPLWLPQNRKEIVTKGRCGQRRFAIYFLQLTKGCCQPGWRDTRVAIYSHAAYKPLVHSLYIARRQEDNSFECHSNGISRRWWKLISHSTWPTYTSHRKWRTDERIIDPAKEKPWISENEKGPETTVLQRRWPEIDWWFDKW